MNTQPRDLVQILIVRSGLNYSVIGMSEHKTEDRLDDLSDAVAIFTASEWMHDRLREPNSQAVKR